MGCKECKTQSSLAERRDAGDLGGRFRLMRYFTLASLVAFAIVATVLYFLQRGEEDFFEEVQLAQNVYFAEAQGRLSARQEENARKSMLESHETAHVTLTRVLANVLWESDFAPFVQTVGRLEISDCRGLAEAAGAEGAARRECFAALGRRIMALPGFESLDARAYAAMRASNVFKIKVFDLRGITVYASEHSQIGEDKADNRGWQLAVAGTPASELTHRDRFSAFEGVVENRDLISSYVPVRASGDGPIVGVFEIYSDVTNFLGRTRDLSADLQAIAADNQRTIERFAAANVEKVIASSDRFLLIVGGLLALLYGVLLLVVRNGQRIIDVQVQDRERAAEREERWHREKMAALATMAANVSHEVGNPLASITAAAQEIQLQKLRRHCGECRPEEILAQARRMAAMTRQICDFAGAPRSQPELVDLNQMLKAVLDFLSFDRRFSAMQIAFDPAPDLPALHVVPDHLNEVLMILLQACVECPSQPEGLSGHVAVSTQGGERIVRILIAVTCVDANSTCATHRPFLDSRFDLVRRRVDGMGGELALSARSVEITLPCAQSCEAPS